MVEQKERRVWSKKGKTIREMMKISDDDKIYELLDKWHDDDEYDNILNAIFEIPRESWSIKLWFRVISAYNNKEEFSEAIDELEQLRPNCVLKEDVAKWYYMYAYIFYARDQYVVAKFLLDRGLEYDSEHESCISLKEECEEYIAKKIKLIREMLEYLDEIGENIQNELKEKDELRDCEGVEFWALLSFPVAFWKVPGVSHCMGRNTFYKCSSEEEKEQLREYLQERYNITDFESTKKVLSSFHNGQDYMDFVSFWNGEGFDINQLNEINRAHFEACMFFGEVIRDYVTDKGIFAADIVDMMMILRLTFACDLISNYEYCQTALQLADLAQEYYHSWKEYAMAYFCGGTYAVYRGELTNLKETCDFLISMVKIVKHLDYWYYNWESE
ncbi:MAG: DUF1266 domain-containing protein [Lachnospiraceae bacterium]|nr:DUF1266 domain-containing protein [Lachnospiraceae bacterium]